jgi:hypothetical protein
MRQEQWHINHAITGLEVQLTLHYRLLDVCKGVRAWRRWEVPTPFSDVRFVVFLLAYTRLQVPDAWTSEAPRCDLASLMEFALDDARYASWQSATDLPRYGKRSTLTLQVPRHFFSNLFFCQSSTCASIMAEYTVSSSNLEDHSIYNTF